MDRVRALVRGRVQGVGFRYFVVRQARGFGLNGWVRNRPDGAVEIEAEGARTALESLIQAVRTGPSGSRIAEVVEDWSEHSPAYRAFEVIG
jgi:acylphosphatase